MGRKVLIITYAFPPDYGIGARRWAKLSKYLFKAGCEVQILSFKKSDNTKKSPWSDDVKEFRGNVDRLSFKPPYYISDSEANTILKKLRYHFSRLYRSWTWKGYLYDSLFTSNKQIEEKLQEYYKKGYRNIIATGAPFYLCYYVSRFALRYPDVTVVSDFRDPWTWGKGYGYPMMTKNRKLAEQKIEKETINMSSYITCPTQKMKDDLVAMYPEYLDKIKLLQHCMDIDDIEMQSIPKINNDASTKVVFGGTLYSGVESFLEEFLSFIDNHNKTMEKKIFCEFYVLNKVEDTAILKYAGKYVIFNVSISSKEFLKKVSSSDFYLAIYPDYFKDVLSTKFMELLHLTNNIIYIGEKGAISDFIEENEIGVRIDSNNIYKSLGVELIKEKRKGETTRKGDDKYYCQNVVEELLRLLQ
jgi:hypothetical protein